MNKFDTTLTFPEISESINVTIKADCAEDSLANIQIGKGTQVHIGSPDKSGHDIVSRIYIETVRISKPEMIDIYSLLFGNEDRDCSTSKTVRFPDGMEMDIAAHSGSEDFESGWTEAILFENGSEVCCTDAEEKIEGIWSICDNDVMYIAIVVPEETPWIAPNIIILPGSCLDSSAKVIAHQTNCKGVMGAGVAKAIRANYPEIMPEYQAECKNRKMLGECQLIATEDGRYIANLFGQDGFGAGRQTDYNALQSALDSLVSQMYSLGLTSVSMPYNLGCGLAGGDWNVVFEMLKKTFSGEHLRLELWQLP